MARLLQRVVEAPRACSYLPGVAASLVHEVMVDVTPEELEARLERGHRRFGPDYFRPACAPCEACAPTRVLTREFSPSKSQRRARRACADLRVVVGRPRVDAARLALYHRWHASREDARAWEPARLDERSYFAQFAFPHPAALEVAYFDPEDGDRLVGVGLSDETPNAWSAIYFFYDPAYARRSIGIANVVFQIELARARGRRHLYLGYRVSDCASLRYKATFHPQEVLVGRPALGEEPRWVLAERL
jgi:arginine-tRNA-protein transferase